MTNRPGESVLAVTEFPSWVIDQTRELGSMGADNTEPNINAGYQDFLLYLCPKDGLYLDQCIIAHDGVGPIINSSSSGTSELGDAGENTVEVLAYLVPKGLTYAEAFADGAAFRLCDRITISSIGPGFSVLDFTSGPRPTRRMRRGDRFVIRIGSLVDQASSSSSASLSVTTIANVSVSILGHTQQG